MGRRDKWKNLSKSAVETKCGMKKDILSESPSEENSNREEGCSSKESNIEEVGSTEELKTEEILTLMNIYLSEWCHRDQLLWKQVYTFFYVTLIVMFLPNLSTFIGIDLPNDFPSFVFPIIALTMSVLFLIVSIGYAMRLSSSGEAYKNVIEKLPKEYQRSNINDEIDIGKFKRIKKVFTCRMTYILSIIMFGSMIILSVVMFLYYYDA